MKRAPAKPRHPALVATAGLTMDFLQLTRRADGLFRAGLLVLGGAIVAGGVALCVRDPAWLVSYLAIALSSAGLIAMWTGQSQRGLPLLPLFAAQHLAIYGVPLVARNPSLLMNQTATITTAGLVVALFLAACGAGWAFGKSLAGASRVSHWNLGLAEGQFAASRCLSLAFLLLGVALAFQLATRTGLIFQILAGPLEGFFPIVRTFADAASMLGGMLGAIVIGGKPAHLRSWTFWGLVAAIGLLSIADVLISAASGLVIAVTVGLSLGMRRLPWRFLLVTFGIIGFLNQGKFVMREKYWDAESNTTGLGLLDLPGLYVEWASASSAIFWGEVPASLSTAREDLEEGQSIFDRVNNLFNLTYVLEVMKGAKIEPLHGETYTLIPKLLIPRFVWKDKPKAHEGQVLLNLHFGRQQTVEQTEKTYIAWGLLPEAVGNFGAWLGPLLVGGFLGLVMGLLEQWSQRIRLFSVEGIVLVALLLKFAGSYEMAASVFVTSSFQFLIASAAGGIFLYHWFCGSRGARRKRRRQHPRGPVSRSRLPTLPAEPPPDFPHAGN